VDGVYENDASSTAGVRVAGALQRPSLKKVGKGSKLSSLGEIKKSLVHSQKRTSGPMLLIVVQV
jgi:hypothetical protein